MFETSMKLNMSIYFLMSEFYSYFIKNDTIDKIKLEEIKYFVEFL